MVLKHKTICGLPAALIAEQIVSRRKAKSKLPLYYQTADIIYPPAINLEQSSSEVTAKFKAHLLSQLPHTNTAADVTGGFGVDAFFLSKTFRSVFHVEPNTNLHQLAAHNHQQLGCNTIVYKNETAEQFIETFTDSLDCIFIDPSRRSAGQKVFKLADCVPNVIQLLPDLQRLAPFILIKTSPLLDVHQALKELKCVERVWVVASGNECKELLFLCNKNFTGEAQITALNLDSDFSQEFSFYLSHEKTADVSLAAPAHYLYEPNAAILKAGAFKLLIERFPVLKIQTSTHLYTSDHLVQEFPGRIFKVMQRVKPDLKFIKEIFTEGKANVITRNYPLSPEELKKKMKLKDGGELYLLGFSGQKEKFLIAAERIK